jgi:hypothetical protein
VPASLIVDEIKREPRPVDISTDISAEICAEISQPSASSATDLASPSSRGSSMVRRVPSVEASTYHPDLGYMAEQPLSRVPSTDSKVLTHDV